MKFLILAITNPAPDLFVNFANPDFYHVSAVVIQMLLGIIGVLSLLFLVVGGYQYLSAGFNTQLAERGKKTITYAILGLIIAILSYIIVTVVINSLFNAD
jgi:hypothetical protein